MHTLSHRVRVTASRPRDHIETISIRVGEVVGVGHRNQQYPEFLWCATEHDRQGWVSESYLELAGPMEAVALRDYDASQLTVVKGELLDVLDQSGVWVLCRSATGVQGWVPASSLEDLVENTPADPGADGASSAS